MLKEGNKSLVLPPSLLYAPSPSPPPSLSLAQLNKHECILDPGSQKILQQIHQLTADVMCIGRLWKFKLVERGKGLITSQSGSFISSALSFG